MKSSVKILLLVAVVAFGVIGPLSCAEPGGPGNDNVINTGTKLMVTLGKDFIDDFPVYPDQITVTEGATDYILDCWYDPTYAGSIKFKVSTVNDSDQESGIGVYITDYDIVATPAGGNAALMRINDVGAGFYVPYTDEVEVKGLVLVPASMMQRIYNTYFTIVTPPPDVMITITMVFHYINDYGEKGTFPWSYGLMAFPRTPESCEEPPA